MSIMFFLRVHSKSTSIKKGVVGFTKGDIGERGYSQKVMSLSQIFSLHIFTISQFSLVCTSRSSNNPYSEQQYKQIREAI